MQLVIQQCIQYLFHSLPLSTLRGNYTCLVPHTVHHSGTRQCRQLRDTEIPPISVITIVIAFTAITGAFINICKQCKDIIGCQCGVHGYVHKLHPCTAMQYLFHSLPLSTLRDNYTCLLPHIVHHSGTRQCRQLREYTKAVTSYITYIIKTYSSRLPKTSAFNSSTRV